MWEVARVGLVRDGALPLWDPHHCGGLTYFGNPQSQAFSPLFPLALLVGTAWASKAFLVVHTALALLGAYRLARVRLGAHPVAAATASVVWALSGFFAWHGGGGHAAFLPFAFLPWALLALRRALVRPRAAAALATWMALSLLEGGIYPALLVGVALAFDAVAALAQGALPRALARAVGVALALFAAAALVRTLPIAVEILRRPRPVDSTDAQSLGEILGALTVRAHGWRVSGHPFVWPEYGAYVGWAPLALAALGLVVAALRRKVDLVVGLVLFVLLALGDRAGYWPWPLLRRLPVYDSLRVPSRFAVLVTLEVALLAALGVDGVVRHLRHPAVLALGAVFALAVTIDLLDVNGGVAERFFREPPIATSPTGRFHLASRGDYARGYASYPARELGTATCYEGLLVRPARGLWTGDVAQVRVDPPTAGEAVEVSRTRDVVGISVRLRDPATLLLNQNFDPDFVSSAGRIRSASGLLAVSLPRGNRRIVVTYRPWTVWPGLIVSLVGFGAIAIALASGVPRARDARIGT